MKNHRLKAAFAAGLVAAISTFCAGAAFATEAEPAASSVPARVGGAVKHGVEVAASAVQHGVTKAANAVERGASATGRAIEKAAQKVGLPASSAGSSPSR
jgi:hypothetical protein